MFHTTRSRRRIRGFFGHMATPALLGPQSRRPSASKPRKNRGHFRLAWGRLHRYSRLVRSQRHHGQPGSPAALGDADMDGGWQRDWAGKPAFSDPGGTMALLDRIKGIFTDRHDGDDKAGGTQTDAQAPALHGRRPQHDIDPRHEQPPAPVERSLFVRIAEGLRGVAGDSRRSQNQQGGRHGNSALDALFGRSQAAQSASRGITGASPFGGAGGEKYREFRLTGAADFSGETRSRGSGLLSGRSDEDRARDRGLTGSTLFGAADKPGDDSDNFPF